MKNFTPLIVVLLLLVACSKDQPLTPNSSTYSISGVVTENGKPIAGIFVSDGVRSAATDDLGRYTINDVPNGTWTIRPMTIGYRYAPDSLKLTVYQSNLTDKNFTAKQISFAEFTRCTFEIHGLVFEMKGLNNATAYDTTDIVFSAKRNLSDLTVMLFDTVVQNPDVSWWNQMWVKNTRIVLQMTSFDHLNAVDYHDIYLAVSSQDWGTFTFDSTNLSLGRISSTGKWTYSVSGGAFLPALITKAETGNSTRNLMGPDPEWKSSNFSLLPTASVRITLAL